MHPSELYKWQHISQYYYNSLNIAQTNGQSKIASDIEYRLSILKSVQNINLDFKKVYIKNTHGDYKIDQIICGKDKINGNISIENMKRYVESYLNISELNSYDLKMMPYFYYFQLAVCNYFGQYYSMVYPNKQLLLKNAHWSTSLCRWFEHNVQTLSDELLRAF